MFGAMTPLLEPILVAGGGRSGTTLLMQLLGTSPRIAFDRVYPFEHRYLTYLIRWAGLLSPGAPPEGWNQTALASRRSELIGPIPWERAEALGGDPDGFRRACFLAAWERFSAAPGHEAGATHYAEKTPPWLAGELDGLLPCTVLMPIRDPRDVFLSVVAFVEKRGRSGFGMQVDEPPLQFAERFVKNQRIRMRQARQAERTGTATIVRYEQMVADLPDEAGRIGSLLDIELDPAAIREEQEQFRGHMTAATPEASVQRWKREMSPEILAVFNEAIGEEMSAAGYEV